MSAIRVVRLLLVAFFAVTWLGMCALIVSNSLVELNSPDTFVKVDIARRVTSPDGSRTAILQRRLAFDLNFALAVIERCYGGGWANDFGIGRRIWFSHDYEPTTYRNWHEELEWTSDSSAIIVRVDGEYVFAYDFATELALEDPVLIERLLTDRVTPTAGPTRTPRPCDTAEDR